MSTLFLITVGFLAAISGAAAVAFYAISDQVRHDKQNFDIHIAATVVCGLSSLFFFLLLFLSL